MKKKAKRKPASKPKPRKVETASKGKLTATTAKDKEELVRIWDEDLCE